MDEQEMHGFKVGLEEILYTHLIVNTLLDMDQSVETNCSDGSVPCWNS